MENNKKKHLTFPKFNLTTMSQKTIKTTKLQNKVVATVANHQQWWWHDDDDDKTSKINNGLMGLDSKELFLYC